MGAAFFSRNANPDTSQIMQNSTDYVHSWIKALSGALGLWRGLLGLRLCVLEYFVRVNHLF